ncbi:hypothetical protein BLNAU_20693 [Blattamonas nauphoetae]|uniref:Uncharacterized protein n=1 Tax=Blattamonas nauphoetae TaxID=2049346 RepID=A0ABQ9WXZ7_9EUKA|nr:hypothetical protein BLNAU_20693 [Blattamonas nauphoetae]
MQKTILSLNSTNDTSLHDYPESPSTVNNLQESFLNFDLNTVLSFEDESRIYRSLVSLVKDEYPFDDALQDKAAQFLKSIEPQWGDQELADKPLIDLVPSSDRSSSGFIESIFTLLLSPHTTVVVATVSLLCESVSKASPYIRLQLVESDLVTQVFAVIQPYTLPVVGHEQIIDCIIRAING